MINITIIIFAVTIIMVIVMMIMTMVVMVIIIMITMMVTYPVSEISFHRYIIWKTLWGSINKPGLKKMIYLRWAIVSTIRVQDCPPEDCLPSSQSWGGQSWDSPIGAGQLFNSSFFNEGIHVRIQTKKQKYNRRNYKILSLNINANTQQRIVSKIQINKTQCGQ